MWNLNSFTRIQKINRQPVLFSRPPFLPPLIRHLLLLLPFLLRLLLLSFLLVRPAILDTSIAFFRLDSARFSWNPRTAVMTSIGLPLSLKRFDRFGTEIPDSPGGKKWRNPRTKAHGKVYERDSDIKLRDPSSPFLWLWEGKKRAAEKIANFRSLYYPQKLSRCLTSRFRSAK